MAHNQEYTLRGALFWGSCQAHYQCFSTEETWNGRAVTHLALAIAEAPPIVGQIISLAELVLIKYCSSNANSPTTPIPDALSRNPQGPVQPIVGENPPTIHASFRKAFDQTAAVSCVNKRINQAGEEEEGTHLCEDQFSTANLSGNCLFWAVFDGHGGDEVSKRASGLFHNYFNNLSSGDNFSEKIKQAYQKFNKDYFDMKTLYIQNLEESRNKAEEIKKANPSDNDYDLLQKEPDFRLHTNVISDSLDQLGAGSTACSLLAVDNFLIAANIGDSRIVLVSESSSELKVEQLTIDHDTHNEDELDRLEKIGLNKDTIRKNKRIGNSQVTRSFGDFTLSSDWKNFDVVEEATSAPVICDPHVSEPMKLTSDHKFVFLMSDGVYDAVSAFRSCDKQEANSVIAEQINKELEKGMPASEAAQTVLNWIINEQKAARRGGNNNCRKLDDLTLMIVPFLDAKTNISSNNIC